MLKNKIFLSTILLTASIGGFTQEGPKISMSSHESFVESNNAKLFCRVMGKGDPIIVIHGGPGLSQDYLLPLEELAKTNKVIFYDQRGSGRSQGTIDAETINVAQFVDDIEAIRKAYSLEKVTILGHSWGGHLAMKYAIAHPESVDKLILLNSMAANSQDFTSFVKEWVARMAPHMKDIDAIKNSNSFLSGNPELVAQYLKIQFRTYCYNPEDANKLHLKMPVKANINGNKSYEILKENYLTKTFDLTDSLKNLHVKTLIIHGANDSVPVETAKHLNQSIPDSKLVVLDKCGHFSFVEKPDETFSALRDFLKE